MTVANSIKAMLDDVKDVMRRQMARIAELEAEVERLRSAASAHEVLKSIYADSNQPTGHRIKAAGLALGHESAPLKSVEPPLDLAAQEVIEPLADVIARQRARCDRMQREARDIEVLPSGAVRVLPKPGSNGGDDSSSDD
jgi:hypothetical protein